MCCARVYRYRRACSVLSMFMFYVWFDCSIAPKSNRSGTLMGFLAMFPTVARTVFDEKLRNKVVHVVDESDPAECWLVPKRHVFVRIPGLRAYRTSRLRKGTTSRFSAEVGQYLGRSGFWTTNEKKDISARRLACFVQNGQPISGRGRAVRGSPARPSQASHRCMTLLLRRSPRLFCQVQLPNQTPCVTASSTPTALSQLTS